VPAATPQPQSDARTRHCFQKWPELPALRETTNHAHNVRVTFGYHFARKLEPDLSDISSPAERPPTLRTASAERPRSICSKSTNDPRFVHGVDGRSKLMRRRRDLIALFTAEIGEVTATGMLEVIRAADATAIAENYRARALRGEAIVLDDLVRLENAAARAVKALANKRQPRDAGPTLAEIIAEHEGAAA
jgi:hypothetical protein